jgi:hypothetical protein
LSGESFPENDSADSANSAQHDRVRRHFLEHGFDGTKGGKLPAIASFSLFGGFFPERVSVPRRYRAAASATVAEVDGFHLLDAALDAGLNFIDTADVYSRWVPGHKGGESETIIGKWLIKTGKRKDVIVATKVGMDMGDGKKGLKAGVHP